MQRVMMNLGIGIGALIGGLIADADHPQTFVVLLLDAATFLVYLGVVVVAVPSRMSARDGDGRPRGSYREVLRHGLFVAFVALNTLFIFAGMSGFELLPVFAKNEAGVSEAAIGAIFFVNTVVIVLAQLPIAKALRGAQPDADDGRARCPLGGLLVVVSIVGGASKGRRRPSSSPS